MIFIADSGSTKCDAVFLNADGTEVCRLRTMGFNPYFHESDFISDQLGQLAEMKKYGNQTTHVFFYGAGCSSPALNEVIKQGLSPVFPNAEINVDHDLKACAYATYDGKPSISCILGTGSNSVFFDGTDIHEEVPAMAFILGDEGSGCYIGKNLITSYFYKTMPQDARKDFFDTYGLTKDEVIDRVYAKPHANVFLASLSHFAFKHKEESFFRDLVFEGFKSFLKIHVQCFPQAKDVKVNFVGSIAYHFEDILDCALEQLSLTKGHIVRRPLDGLIHFHMENLNLGSEVLKSNNGIN